MNHEHASPLCRELLAQISDYVDGELGTELCAQLEKHLATCPDCRVVVDTTRKTVLLFKRCYRPADEPPAPAITDRLWRALAEAGCGPSNPENPPD